MTLPPFPPFYGPGEWWSHFLRLRLEMPQDDAIVAANRQSGLKRRDWLRMAIKGGATLPIPVAGSASVLKNGNPQQWLLAKEAGRQVNKIRATLATEYGREPFFHLVAGALPPFGDGSPLPASAGEACLGAFDAVSRILGLADPRLLDGLKEAMARGDSRLREISASAKGRADLSLSILDPLFRLGPDAIFALLPAF